MSKPENTLARWIVEKGIDNVRPEMLSEDMKFDIFTEVGMIFFKRNDLESAIKALSLAKNPIKLSELGDELMKQNRFREAAIFYIPTNDRKRLEKVAAICAKEGENKLAYEAYVAAGNIEMAAFIRENS